MFCLWIDFYLKSDFGILEIVTKLGDEVCAGAGGGTSGDKG
jgi:hypothetical protein